jgi:hypothetical protein
VVRESKASGAAKTLHVEREEGLRVVFKTLLLKEKQEVESFVVLQGNEGEVEIVREEINVVVNEDADIIFCFLNQSINWPLLSLLLLLLLLIFLLCACLNPSTCLLDLDYPIVFHIFINNFVLPVLGST